MELSESIKSLRFLVTDDYESMRMLVQEELESLGVKNITFATSGNEALKIISQLQGTGNSIQFVITDMMMDNGSGKELTQALRSKAPLNKMPILMVSSMSEASFILDCITAGIDDYIVKPWETDDLVKKIQQICQKKGLVKASS